MNDYLTPFEALKRAVDQAGGQSATARLCSVSQTAVWKWLQSSKRLPAEYVIRMEKVTGVSRHVLRPDIYPIEDRQQVPNWFGHTQPNSRQHAAHLAAIASPN